MQSHSSESAARGLRRGSVFGCALLALGLTAEGAFAADDERAYAPAVLALADKLASRFVDPSVGARYAEMLRANLAAGRYDEPGDAKALAVQLTGDLQAVAADGHLRVDLAPQPSDAPRGVAPEEAPDGKDRANGARRPPQPPMSSLAPLDLPSVAETRWIADGVAYLRFNQFAGEPASVEAMRAFVNDYASAKAIIIDTRTLSRGGGLAEMDVLFPHVFDRETVLVEMAVARSGRPPPMGGATLREVAGPANLLVRQHIATPDATAPRLVKAKVFYLTSRRTRSAGEHFALALQRTHRGTLIGERTAGANHFGGVEPIGAGLFAFIPVGRTYDPDTGKDWEGDGVVPDIVVPVDEALDRALALARD